MSTEQDTPQKASVGRLILRVVLVLILLGILGVGFLGWRNNQPEALWQRAQAAIEAGEREDAKLYLLSLVKKDPEHGDAHFELSKIIVEEAKEKDERASFTNVKAAFEHLEQAAKLKPKDKEVQMTLLNALQRAGRVAPAGKVADGILKFDPQNSQALYARANARIAAKELKQAEADVKALSPAAGKPSISILWLQWRLSFAKGDKAALAKVHDRAIEITRKPPAKITPLNFTRLNRMQQDAVEKAKDVKTAHERMEISLKLQEARAKAAKQPVQASLQANRLAKALIKGHPKVEDQAKVTRGKLLARVLNLGDAALKSGKALPQFHLDQVDIATHAGDHERTAEVTERTLKALKSAKNFPVEKQLAMRAHLATRQITLGKYKTAREHIKALQADSQFEYFGNYLSGIIALHEGRLKEARIDLEKARRKKSSNPQIRLALAQALVGLKEWKAALPHFQFFLAKSKTLTKEERQQTAKLLGDADTIRLALATAYLQLKDPQAATPYINALRGAKQESVAMAMKAQYYWQQGKKELARKTVSDARVNDPKNVSLAKLDAAFKQADGKTAAADRVVAELVAANKSDLATRFFELEWAMRKRDDDETLRLIHELKAQYPKHKMALTAAETRILLRKREYEQAGKLAAELRKSPEWKATGEQLGAQAAIGAKNLNEAGNLLASAASGQRRSGGINLAQGQFHFQKGDTEAAAKSFAEALKFRQSESSAGRGAIISLMKLANEKDPAKAEALVDQFLADNPSQPTLVLAKAELQRKQGRFADAVNTVKQFEKLKPKTGPVYAFRLYMSLGRTGEARQALGRAVIANPQSAAIRLLVAQTALGMKQYSSAISQADVGLTLNPKSVPLALVRAAALVASEKTSEALTQLTKLTEQHPADARVWLALSRLHFSQKDNAKGFATLATARKQNPKNGALATESILRLLREKNTKEAASVAEAYEKASPGFQSAGVVTRAFLAGREFATAKTWGAKAKAAAKTDKEKLAIDLLLADIALSEARAKGDDKQLFENAKQAYSAILKQNPDNGVAANNLAWLLSVKFNDHAGAMKVLQPMLKKYTISQLPRQVFDTVVSIHLRTNQTDKAAQLLDDAIRLRANEKQWLTSRVNLAMQTANVKPVISLLMKLKSDRPRSAEPPFALARMYAAQRKNEASLRELDIALNLDPKHKLARRMAMEMNVRVKKHDATIIHADALLKIDPEFWIAYQRKAEALKALKKDNDAKSTLGTAIEKLNDVVEKQKKPDAALIVQLAKFHDTAGDDKQELDVLLKALKAAPKNLLLVNAALEAHLDAKQLDAAIKLADAQFGKDPNIGQCLSVARTFKKAKQPAAAIKWAETAVKMSKTNNEKIASHWTLGDLHLDEGTSTGKKSHFETARDHYRAVLKIQPTHLVAANNLAWVLAEKLDAAKEGLTILETYRGKTPPEKLHLAVVDTYASVYRRAGMAEKARVMLEKAINAHPENAVLYYALGLTYIDLKRNSAATRMLRKAITMNLDPEKGRKAREALRSIQ